MGQTLADGLSGNVDPDTLTWDYIRDLVDEVVTVSEDDLAEGLRGLVAEDHLIAEGAGIAAVAAVAARRVALDGSRAAIVVSGANIDNSKLARLTNAIDDYDRIRNCEPTHRSRAERRAHDDAPATHHHRREAFSGSTRSGSSSSSSRTDFAARKSSASCPAV